MAAMCAPATPTVARRAAAEREDSAHPRARAGVAMPAAEGAPGQATSRPHEDGDVYALFDAAIGQQLQGAAHAGAAWHSLSSGRDRHLAGREPHARVFGHESERPGAAVGNPARPFHRGVERHPVVRRRRHRACARGPHRSRRGAAMDVLRAAQSRAQSRRGLFLAGSGQGRP